MTPRSTSPTTSRATAAHLNDPTYFSIVVFLIANAAVSEHYAELHLELFDRDTSRGAAVFQIRNRARLDPTRHRRAGRRPMWCGRRSSTPAWPSTSSSTSTRPCVRCRVILRTYGTPKALARLRSRASATHEARRPRQTAAGEGGQR